MPSRSDTRRRAKDAEALGDDAEPVPPPPPLLLLLLPRAGDAAPAGEAAPALLVADTGVAVPARRRTGDAAWVRAMAARCAACAAARPTSRASGV